MLVLNRQRRTAWDRRSPFVACPAGAEYDGSLRRQVRQDGCKRLDRPHTATAGPTRAVCLALFLTILSAKAYAQQVIGGAPTGQVLMTSQFRIPGTYEAALAKLGAFYEEQVGRKLPVAFPEISPRQHYDVWHDIWVGFGPDDDQLTVTMKRPADSITSRMVRVWMLEFAGRLGAEVPIQYRELPAPATSETDIFATPIDLPAIFKSLPSMKAVPTWEHLGLAVSTTPMLSVAMDAAGPLGVHHVTLLAENAAAMRQLSAALNQGLQRPCICGVYSEIAEIETEVSGEVQSQTAMIGTHSSGLIFTPEATRKHEQDIVRSRPEMQKRIAEATGYYNIKFRPDRSYPRANLTWVELQGYSKETGQFQNERVLGRTSVAAPRVPPSGTGPLNARIKLAPLQPGAYRIRLEAEGPGGQPLRIDERIFWFDGMKFEEL
jgi:hypothetical protein